MTDTKAEELTAGERNLRECQKQLDMDGVMVGVSRQALEETLALLDASRAETEAVRRNRNLWRDGCMAVAYDFNDLRSLAAELVEGLERAGATFLSYAFMHQQKRTPEGDEKAARNLAMAEECKALAARARAQGIGEKEKAGGFYLQDSRSYVGNCVLWWRDGGGYTTRLHEAQVFTEEEATRLHANRATDVPWPVATIRGVQHGAVDAQRLPKKDTPNA